ncbi:protein Mis18-alpha-like [Peromyscus eremicus]|uniref:protein Mis18-alpha-like n=1 Tax=Peromyscus eremicus TaxID=42410 RepID=UPI0027DC2188|nr:protein Mis18-alpha-like [Peromyscus eremicus]
MDSSVVCGFSYSSDLSQPLTPISGSEFVCFLLIRPFSGVFPVGLWGAAGLSFAAASCPLGCSSTCCVCNHQGTWSESSLPGKRASMSSAAAAEAEEARENPLVFLCSRCSRPLGDSLTWVTNREDNNCILLRCVSSNVSVDKEQKLSKCEGEEGCVLETLYCAGCSLSLGCVYRCTPRNLDYKRDLFCLSVEAIESYTLGSAEKQIESEDKEPFNLESRVEIEKSIKQMEDVLKALQTKLLEVESKLPFAGGSR